MALEFIILFEGGPEGLKALKNELELKVEDARLFSWKNWIVSASLLDLPLGAVWRASQSVRMLKYASMNKKLFQSTTKHRLIE